tara:strand:+ start:69 stop:488 length:420 start_codon:yes stop_codon:yes gene_type:complete
MAFLKEERTKEMMLLTKRYYLIDREMKDFEDDYETDKDHPIILNLHKKLDETEDIIIEKKKEFTDLEIDIIFTKIEYDLMKDELLNIIANLTPLSRMKYDINKKHALHNIGTYNMIEKRCEDVTKLGIKLMACIRKNEK